jgi:hypothetical protein
MVPLLDIFGAKKMILYTEKSGALLVNFKIYMALNLGEKDVFESA